MDAVEYRMIKLEELSRELFRSFQRRQVVNLCWRREAGRWVRRKRDCSARAGDYRR